jgi:hypothetical protein
MWIFDAMSKVPFQKLYLTLLTTLGAGFLLLAYLFGLDPLAQPVLYPLIAVALFFVQRKDVPILQGFIFVIVITLLAQLFVPRYYLLFSLAFSAACGKFIFRTSARLWKWAACAALSYAAIHTASAWQQMNPFYTVFPSMLLPLLHAAIFAFCLLCSFLPYYLIKDSVLSAFDSYLWQDRAEPARVALQAKKLYESVITELRKQCFEERVLDEIEEFSEKMIHHCHQMQEINAALSQVDLQQLSEEIGLLEAKIAACSDLSSKRNYEKALTNRKKQRSQYEALEVQAERIRSQVLNYISALENVRFAYAHRHFSSTDQGTDGIDFLLQMAKNQAENVYETSEAYQKLT